MRSGSSTASGQNWRRFASVCSPTVKLRAIQRTAGSQSVDKVVRVPRAYPASTSRF